MSTMRTKTLSTAAIALGAVLAVTGGAAVASGTSSAPAVGRRAQRAPARSGDRHLHEGLTAARLQDLDPQPGVAAEAAVEGDELGVHRSRLGRQERIGHVAVCELA